MILLAVGLLLGTAPLVGVLPQENSPTDDKKGRFFSREIDFWKTGTSRPSVSLSEPDPARPIPFRESIWAEPTRMPDGRFAIYLPPQRVLEFLEDPTPKTLQAYVAWKKERAEKLRRALSLLEKWKRKESEDKRKNTFPTPSLRGGRVTVKDSIRDRHPPVLKAQVRNPNDRPPLEMTYFHADG